MRKRIFVGRKEDREPYIRITPCSVSINRVDPGKYLIKFHGRRIHLAKDSSTWNVVVSERTRRGCTSNWIVMRESIRYFYGDKKPESNHYPVFVSYGRCKGCTLVFSKWRKE